VRALTPIARGTNATGYVGVLVEDWMRPGERDLAACGHRHASTNEARHCARDHAARLGLAVEAPRSLRAGSF
jgi:hypothetical protein